MRVGTPPVLQLAALEQALTVWDDVELSDVRAASIVLTDLFIQEVEKRCPELTLISPRDSSVRGSQVSFAFENGFAAMQALIAHDVIGDFRAPNVMRFGFTPLYIDAKDVLDAVEILENILSNKLWDTAEYRAAKKVT
jgi:kynureninase